jgi:hypothetical protein
MADSYMAIAEIANDESMKERMYACVTQQAHIGNAPSIANDPRNTPFTWAALNWVDQNRYLWASSPEWGAAWDSALAGHPDDSTYQPGKDASVITDAQILATVQSFLAPPSET